MEKHDWEKNGNVSDPFGFRSKNISGGLWFRLTFLLIATAFGCAYASGAENRKWEPEVRELLARSKEAFINGGLCGDQNDCVRKQLILANSESWGITVGIYGVSNQAVLRDITSIFADAYFKKRGGMTIKARIYPVSKVEQVKTPFWKSIQYMKITFEGDEKNAVR